MRYLENLSLLVQLNQEVIYTKAEEYLDKVIYDFEIKDGKAMFYKGMLYLAIDQDDEGCDYLNKAVQSGFSGEGSLVVFNRFCINSP